MDTQVLFGIGIIAALIAIGIVQDRCDRPRKPGARRQWHQGDAGIINHDQEDE